MRSSAGSAAPTSPQEPSVFSMNQRHCLVSLKMPRYYVIVTILEYLDLKIISLKDVDSAIESEQTMVTRVSEVFVRCF